MYHSCITHVPYMYSTMQMTFPCRLSPNKKSLHVFYRHQYEYSAVRTVVHVVRSHTDVTCTRDTPEQLNKPNYYQEVVIRVGNSWACLWCSQRVMDKLSWAVMACGKVSGYHHHWSTVEQPEHIHTHRHGSQMTRSVVWIFMATPVWLTFYKCQRCWRQNAHIWQKRKNFLCFISPRQHTKSMRRVCLTLRWKLDKMYTSVTSRSGVWLYRWRVRTTPVSLSVGWDKRTGRLGAQ